MVARKTPLQGGQEGYGRLQTSETGCLALVIQISAASDRYITIREIPQVTSDSRLPPPVDSAFGAISQIFL